ncbi:MAG TPA: phosphate--AMP phosphotransferase [Gemmatimonadota bacterium]|jgi:polyphosphate kinase 2 (PPK2 family)
MLETVDLSLELDKQTYKSALPGLQDRLRGAQNLALQHGIPVIVVFEGWDAAGKGENIALLTEKLDPRHFRVHAIGAPKPEEAGRPFLWRFWRRLPPRGDIALFDRSWYGRVLVERVDGLTAEEEWTRGYDEIGQFERQLTDDGALIVKLWLQISRKEQKKRLKKLDEDPTLTWKVTHEDWVRHRKQYDDYAEAIEEMLAKTSTTAAPWTIVEAEDDRYAAVKIHETIIRAIEDAARARGGDGGHGDPGPGGDGAHGNPGPGGDGAAVADAAPDRTATTEPIARKSALLERLDMSVTLPREEYDEILRPLQAELRDLQGRAHDQEVPVLIVYEGWDASGKGGNIKRLTRFLDPRGYSVTAYAAPTSEEKRHHYLWRFWRDIPAGGELAIFDRSWYGRVLVERVEGFCTEREWRRAYQEINEFEGQLAAAGMVLIKFWLHITQEEQLRRFQSRAGDKFRHWKLTDEDWRNREKFSLYQDAVLDMLERTSTAWAPWTVVEANDKPFARVKALRTTIAAIEAAVGGNGKKSGGKKKKKKRKK